MKLFELSGRDGQSVGNAALRAEVINQMRLESRIFEFAEFYQMAGSADAPKKASTETGGDERTINNDFAGNTGAPTTGSIALKILGDKISVDKAYERRYVSIGSERLSELRSFARGLARHFMNRFINGTTVDPKQFDGTKVRCTGARLTSIDGGADGFQVLLGNSDAAVKSQQKFIKALGQMINRVNPTVLIMNGDTIAYIEEIEKQFVRLDNIDGVTELALTRYKNIPVINAGRAKDDTTNVITLTETKGASNDCTSIYAVKFGERENTTLATNVGLVVDDLGLVGTQYVTNVELDVDMEILSTYGAQRMEGIRLG